MSEFGNYLRSVIKRSGKPAYEFAARMGVGDTHLSAFVRGRRVGVNSETLAKMVAGISDDPHVQAGLLEAYFKDLALPEMKDWVSVFPPSRLIETPPIYGPKDDAERIALLLRRLALPTAVVTALFKLIETMPDRDALQDLVIDLAEFAEDALQPKPLNRVPHKP